MRAVSPQNGQLPGGTVCDSIPQSEKETEETAQRVMQGGELGIQRMARTEVHVQRMSSVERDDTFNPGKMAGRDTGDGIVTEKIDEATTKRYRLTKTQLQDMVSKVDTADELAAYIENHNLEALSTIQDSLSSGFGGAMKGWKAGSMAGPAGTVAGGLVGVPLGYFLATKFGKQTADKIQTIARNVLDLNTDQEFSSEDDRSGESLAEKAKGLF